MVLTPFVRGRLGLSDFSLPPLITNCIPAIYYTYRCASVFFLFLVLYQVGRRGKNVPPLALTVAAGTRGQGTGGSLGGGADGLGLSVGSGFFFVRSFSFYVDAVFCCLVSYYSFAGRRSKAGGID